ncbi:MAG: hypothetical protein H0T46_34205 [Deltaproteobacteria bacterium]|nr:hypothetical protein [Deltaproteobacteria bacterium]
MKTLVVVALLLGFASAAQSDGLKVSIKPATSKWKVKARVAVTLKITNTGKTMSTFSVWLCSWGDQWVSSDNDLTWEPWGCDKNAPMPVGLAPGKSREWKLDMFAIDAARPGKHQLKMTFTPEGSGKSITSNAAAITVIR